MTDPRDPKEILLNMALNGCGRKGRCSNRYCKDNPSKNSIFFKDVITLLPILYLITKTIMINLQKQKLIK